MRADALAQLDIGARSPAPPFGPEPAPLTRCQPCRRAAASPRARAGEAGAGGQLCLVWLPGRHGAQLAQLRARPRRGGARGFRMWKAAWPYAWCPAWLSSRAPQRTALTMVQWYSAKAEPCSAPLQAVPQQPGAPPPQADPQPLAAGRPGAASAPPLTAAKLLSKLSKAEARRGVPPAPDSAMNFRPAVRGAGPNPCPGLDRVKDVNCTATRACTVRVVQQRQCVCTHERSSAGPTRTYKTARQAGMHGLGKDGRAGRRWGRSCSCSRRTSGRSARCARCWRSWRRRRARPRPRAPTASRASRPRRRRPLCRRRARAASAPGRACGSRDRLAARSLGAGPARPASPPSPPPVALRVGPRGRAPLRSSQPRATARPRRRSAAAVRRRECGRMPMERLPGARGSRPAWTGQPGRPALCCQRRAPAWWLRARRLEGRSIRRRSGSCRRQRRTQRPPSLMRPT